MRARIGDLLRVKGDARFVPDGKLGDTALVARLLFDGPELILCDGARIHPGWGWIGDWTEIVNPIDPELEEEALP